MNIVGFDDKIHKFNFSKNRARNNRQNKSSYHMKALELIKDLFSNYSIYEEATLPGSKKVGRKSLLYADFFIPEKMMIIEVHGEQHYKYCPIFHKDKMDYYRSLNRDKDKLEWCQINNINLKILKYNEGDTWKSTLLSEK